MDIVAAYEQVGTYRGAAALCGTTHKTVRRVIEANQLGEAPARPRRSGPRNTDVVRDLIAEKVRATDGRISAKRLLPAARAAGYGLVPQLPPGRRCREATLAAPAPDLPTVGAGAG